MTGLLQEEEEEVPPPQQQRDQGSVNPSSLSARLRAGLAAAAFRLSLSFRRTLHVPAYDEATMAAMLGGGMQPPPADVDLSDKGSWGKGKVVSQTRGPGDGES